MWRAIEKLVALFAVIVFVTFLINHGLLDFRGVDWTVNQTKKAIESEQGKEYIDETKGIAVSVLGQFIEGIKELVEIKNDKAAENNLLNEAKLLAVIDGDTLKVIVNSEEQTIRLIGIDTPESVNPDESKNTEYGKLASEYTKKLLENVSTIYLEYDVSKEDTYGRTLAYVWLNNELKEPEINMLNAILVKNGYALDKVYMPNNKYADIFVNLRLKASEEQTGLWSTPAFL